MDNNLLIANIKTKTFLHALGLLTINEFFFKFIIIIFLLKDSLNYRVLYNFHKFHKKEKWLILKLFIIKVKYLRLFHVSNFLNILKLKTLKNMGTLLRYSAKRKTKITKQHNLMISNLVKKQYVSHGHDLHEKQKNTIHLNVSCESLGRQV